MKITTTKLALGFMLAGVLCSGAAFGASDYPTRPVTIVVGFAPGGSTDLLARYEAEVLERALHQPFVVKNLEGAGGILAAGYVARAAPDGYTLLHVGTSFSMIPQFKKNLPYDPLADFQAVSHTAVTNYMLVVSPSLKVGSVRELIDLAKKKPGQLTFASAGLGTSQFFFGELFKSMAKIDIRHVPYKGSAPALVDVMAGRISMMFVDLPPAIGLVREGKLKGLAIGSLTRRPDMPDVPTIAETLPGFETIGWQGLLAKSGTPKAIVDKLDGPLAADLKRPETAARFKKFGADAKGSTPEEFEQFIRAQFRKWKQVAHDSGLKAS